MKKILILLAVLFLVGCQQESNEDLTNYFSENLQTKVIQTTGQPIEGFQPFMFQNVYPGLIDNDFNNVDAMLGEYKVSGTELTFKLTQQQPIHSAAEAITKRGMEILLKNLSSRLNIPITDRESIDKIITSISS